MSAPGRPAHRMPPFVVETFVWRMGVDHGSSWFKPGVLQKKSSRFGTKIWSMNLRLRGTSNYYLHVPCEKLWILGVKPEVLLGVFFVLATGDQQLNDTKHYATLPIAAARAAIVGYTATLYHDAVHREVPSNKRKNKSFLKCITKTPQKPCCSGFQPLWVPDRDGLLDFRNFQSWIEQTFFLPAVISVNKEILHIWLCLK